MKYNRLKDKTGQNNYDRLRAYMQIKFARQNQKLGKVWSREQSQDSIITQLINLSSKQYSNQTMF